MLKRIPWVAVALVLLVIGALLTLQQSLYPWPKRLRHVRLEPSRPILRDVDVTPDNAFFYLRQLTSGPSSSDEWSNEYDRFSALGMQGGPYPALEARLTDISGNLDLCRQAAALPKCQVVTAESNDTLLPYLGPVRDVARNLWFSTERAAAKGDWAAAGEDYRVALGTGDYVTRGGGLINHLINYACSAIACESLRRLPTENGPPLEFSRGMIRALDELDGNAEPFVEVMRYERLLARDLVRVVDNRLSVVAELGSPGGPPPRTSGGDGLARVVVLPLMGSTPRRTAAHLDNAYSRVIDIAAEARPSGRSTTDESLGFLQHRGKLVGVRVIFDDPVGRLLMGMLVSGLDSAADKHWAHVATLRGTEIVLALRLYQRTHDGKLPARLDDLVPDCLSAVPVDPFSRDGEPFLYRVDADGKWLVYSRGPNLRDDGAVWNYLDFKVRTQHRDSLDIIFSASEPEQRRDHWRLEHPGAK